jgi:hypothetical protein
LKTHHVEKCSTYGPTNRNNYKWVKHPGFEVVFFSKNDDKQADEGQGSTERGGEKQVFDGQCVEGRGVHDVAYFDVDRFIESTLYFKVDIEIFLSFVFIDKVFQEIEMRLKGYFSLFGC